MDFYTNVTRYGNSILYRGYRDGIRVSQKVHFKPTMFVPSEQGDWRTLKGQSVSPMTFDSMKDATDFMKKYEGVHNFEVSGNTNFAAQFVDQNFPEVIEFDRNMINVCTIDIEVMSDEGFPHQDKAEYPIITITCKNNIDNTYYVWGLYDYDVSKSIMQDNKVVYVKAESESHLLMSFLDWWSHPANTPDIITGWNSKLFDMVYIINRIGNTIGADFAKKLSPWRRINHKPVMLLNKQHDAYEVVGVQQLDYMDLFRKFGYKYGPQASYKLDAIANVVLGVKKLSYEEHGSLFTLYKEDFQKFVDYNIRDVELVDKMEDKTGLITLAMTMAYKAGVNYDQTFGTTSIWDTFIYRELSKRKIAVPQNVPDVKTDFGGGHVKDPVVGRHEWICSFDLNSLYPHLIMQYNMSPETIVNDQVTGMNPDSILAMRGQKINPKPDFAMAATGQLFRKDKRGFIPEIIEGLYAERKVIKKRMLEREQDLVNLKGDEGRYEIERDIATFENQQMAIKILMNSLYGAMGNIHFRYFDIRIASAITASGRLSIRWAEQTVNKFMNQIIETKDKDYVVAIDTDSLYIKMADLINRFKPKDPVNFLDRVCADKLEPILEQGYQELADTMSAYENKMVMAREVIADRGIWTAKKRYILNVHNSEGVAYPEPKLKIMGIEAVKSSTPEVCKAKFKEVFKILIGGTEEEMRKFVNDFKKEFKNLPPEEIAAPRGITNLSKYADRTTMYVKGTPLHVRGALVYNQAIKMAGLEKRYQPVGDSERIKYLYMKMPNPMKENVISFPEDLPKALNLNPYIDYNTQFEKVFEDSLTIILDAIGWKVKEVATLEDFFA